MEHAVVWEPRPDWRRLRMVCDLSEWPLDRMLPIAGRLAPQGSLLQLVSPAAPVTLALSSSIDALLLAAISQILSDVEQEWLDRRPCLRDCAARLAGLGNGLTPAGDDFLIGMMLAIWIHHPAASAICRPIVRAAAARTTRLSGCLLAQAGEGLCSVSWHRFFGALAGKETQPLRQAMARIVAHGHTSGSDALAGFLWTARRLRAAPLTGGNHELVTPATATVGVALAAIRRWKSRLKAAPTIFS